MKKKLINELNYEYFKELEDPHMGYNNITMQKIFNYLRDRCRDAISIDLEEAEKHSQILLMHLNPLEHPSAGLKKQSIFLKQPNVLSHHNRLNSLLLAC